ncbi:MAG: hypothetical protein KA170_04830 [Candidatus Promineofilum sp.]|nr:hypothetical protein [Promineifilum sp.]
MGPLVYYCRWQGAKLRLRGRDEGAVWGLLITRQGDAEVTEPFRFDLLSWELWLGDDEGRRLRLDELGVVVDETPRSPEERG